MTSANDILEGGMTAGGDTDDADGSVDRTPAAGDTQTGGMGVDVAALGGGGAMASGAPPDEGQAGPDIDGGSR